MFILISYPDLSFRSDSDWVSRVVSYKPCILSLCAAASQAPKSQRQLRERRRQGTVNNDISYDNSNK